MSFVVIEGDNGTGKDTLAQNLNKFCNYRNITDEYNVKELNRSAKKYDGKKRIKEFLKYGKVCSDIVKKSKGNIVLVRYWISTLAAAYADDIYNYEETLKIEKDMCSKFYKPDVIICLWCSFEKRIERIEKRRSLDFDDITKIRSDKYKCFLNNFQNRTDIKWINIDTTNKSKDEVFNEVCKYIEI